MSKVADKKHDHKAHGGHKAHKPKPKPKPVVKHVHHHHYHNTVNNNTTINAPTPAPPQAPLLDANQNLFNGFTAFLGGLFGSLTAQPPVLQPSLFDFPAFPSYPSYPAASTSWPVAAPSYPSNGSAGGWSAWGTARGAAY